MQPERAGGRPRGCMRPVQASASMADGRSPPTRRQHRAGTAVLPASRETLAELAGHAARGRAVTRGVGRSRRRRRRAARQAAGETAAATRAGQTRGRGPGATRGERQMPGPRCRTSGHGGRSDKEATGHASGLLQDWDARPPTRTACCPRRSSTVRRRATPLEATYCCWPIAARPVNRPGGRSCDVRLRPARGWCRLSRGRVSPPPLWRMTVASAARSQTTPARAPGPSVNG